MSERAKMSFSKLDRSTMIYDIAILIIAGVMIWLSVLSLNIIETCKEQGYDSDASKKTVERNKEIIMGLIGVASGLIAFKFL